MRGEAGPKGSARIVGPILGGSRHERQTSGCFSRGNEGAAQAELAGRRGLDGSAAGLQPFHGDDVLAFVKQRLAKRDDGYGALLVVGNGL